MSSDTSIDPEQAVDQYLSARSNELSDSSIQNQRYRLTRFIEWAEESDFDDVRDLDGRCCEAYRLWRENDDSAPITIQQQLQTFRVFVDWCESMEYVREGVSDLIRIPSVDPAERRREEAIDAETAREILEYREKFDYASLTHVLFALSWHTGGRLGGLRALDVNDWYHNYDDEGHLDAYLAFYHRPESGTPLKLKQRGERHVSILDQDVADLINDYLEHSRPNVTDDHGREPLLATQSGPIAKNTLRSHIYRATMPCNRGDGSCPHGRGIDSCVALADYHAGSKCPSSVSPHDIRRSAITAHLNADIPVKIISERTNVSVDTLEEHYDVRSQEQKRKRRRQYLD